MKGEGKRRDVEKERYWRKVIGEAARSGVSTRQFCPAFGGEAEEESVLLVAEEIEGATGREGVRERGQKQGRQSRWSRDFCVGE